MKDPTVDHIDSNRRNNHYSNLRWIERSINSSIRKIKPKGELNGQHVLIEKEVIEICEMLQENKLNLKQIGEIYGVPKSTISNIKRGRTWTYISKNYNFIKRKQKDKESSKKQREEIKELLFKGLKPTEIIKLGYSKTVVYRVKSSTGSK